MQGKRQRLSSLRPTPALVIASIALVFSMAGGAFAALDLIGKNDIKSKHVKDESLLGKDVKNGKLTAADLGDDAVGGGEIADGAIGSADLSDGAVGSADLSDGAVGSADIANGGVSAADLGTVVVRSELLNDTDATADDNDWEATMGEVDCLPGERAIGGGATLAFGGALEDTAITRSGFDPSGAGGVDNDQGWIVGIVSDQGGAGDKIIEVYCLR